METSLNSDHQLEVKKFLDFFALKRRENLKEIETSARQFTSKNLNEDALMQKSEVEAFLDNFTREVTGTIEAELQNLAHMSGVYIKILMHQAETQGLYLQADTAFIENQHAIEEMKTIERSHRVSDLNKRSQGARLPTLAAGFNNDPQITKQLNELKEENKEIKNRLKQTQAQLSEILDERNSLRDANRELLAQMESHGRSEEHSSDRAEQLLEETKVNHK